MSHLLILPVILPGLMAGLIVAFARSQLQLQRIATALVVLALIGVAGLSLVCATVGPEAYFLGNWPAPFGIVLMLDRLSALMLALVAVLSGIVLIYVIGTGWDRRGKHFHALFLFQLMGLNGAFLTGDAFNLFVFFELLLIASYGLMIHGGGADRLRAGVQYVAFNLVGSTLFLFGLGLIYAVTGTLNMADLAGRIAALPAGDAALLRVAAVMILLVFAVKGALVPLQFWLPGTYANAPGPVAALFAVMTKVGAYAVIRFSTLVFPPDSAAIGSLVADLLTPAALATLTLGAIGVLGSHSLPRQVSFAAIGSMGMLFLAVAAGTPAATSAALYYLLHSTLATAALFLIADLVAARRGGPGAQSGLIAALFMAGAVAMAGMPPLSGFIGKLLVMDALRADAVWAWSAILLASLATMIGFARMGSALFWSPQEPDRALAIPQDRGGIAAVLLCLAALVGLTVFAGPVTGWLDVAAENLHAPAAYISANDLRGGT
ncbi:MAG: monovalent cation/H+ antiporter subunit D [Rhodobacteraceae bacterium]|nr:monovalent cation/H+ antiporter subunit D [Paracoccaceae bacterium]